MGKHDELGHALHIPKARKFKQQPPATAPLEQQIAAPQEPKPGSQAKNQFR